jgi:hypothetical protein
LLPVVCMSFLMCLHFGARARRSASDCEG